MATSAEYILPPSFIRYLLDNDPQETRKRRRMARFNVVYDGSKMAGVNWKNPLTGHNYGYYARIDNTDLKAWAKQDTSLKVAAYGGAVNIAIGLSYAAVLSKKWWWYPLVVLMVGVGETEVGSAILDYYTFGRFKTEAEYTANFRDELDNDTGDMQDEIDIIFRGDPEYAASKMWFGHAQDKVSFVQGSSIVSSTCAGFAVHRWWWMGMRKRHGWLAWILGLLACYPLLDNVMAVYVAWGPDAEMGAQVGHLYHLMGLVSGAATSWYIK